MKPFDHRKGQKHSFDRQVVHETAIKSEQMFLTEVYSRF